MPDTTYMPKVYKKDGGDTLVVASGGQIAVEAGGKIGSCPTVADSVATDAAGVVTDFNALLAKLRLAGIIA